MTSPAVSPAGSPLRSLVQRRRRLLAAVGSLLVLLLGGGGYFLWSWFHPYDLPQIPAGLNRNAVGLDFTLEMQAYQNQLPGALSDPKLPVQPRPDPALAHLQFEAGRQLLDQGRVDDGLAYMAAAMQAAPENLLYGNELRLQLAKQGRWSQLTTVWDTRAPGSRGQTLQAALSAIDAMGDPNLNDIELAKHSFRSVELLDRLLEQNPLDWMAHYARGVNNLYWPSGLYRSAKTLSDLSFCVAVVEKLDLRDPWLDMSYAAYGDALVKAGRPHEGFRAWTEGQKRFPQSAVLQERTRGGEENAPAIVAQERGMEAFTRPKPGLTDLGPMWHSEKER